MTPRLTEASYAGGYRINVSFEDGTHAEIDLEGELWGDVFEPLKDPQEFRSFRLDPELHTIVWANGADFAPEFLYAQAIA